MIFFIFCHFLDFFKEIFQLLFKGFYHLYKVIAKVTFLCFSRIRMFRSYSCRKTGSLGCHIILSIVECILALTFTQLLFSTCISYTCACSLMWLLGGLSMGNLAIGLESGKSLGETESSAFDGGGIPWEQISHLLSSYWWLLDFYLSNIPNKLFNLKDHLKNPQRNVKTNIILLLLLLWSHPSLAKCKVIHICWWYKMLLSVLCI